MADRPWGRTLAALGLRGVTGQLALVADGKRFLIAFEGGAVVAAASPLTSDAAVRVALTGHLVSSSQVPEISRRQALAPERDEIDVIAELARLGPEHALRLRRRVIAQRAARTFSIAQGEFAVTDRAELAVLDGCELDIRAVIYMGARANLSEHRLRTELDQLGSWFRLKPDLDDDLPQFGFADIEQPVIERLRDGGTIEDLEEFASSFVDSRTVRAVVYALASYNACDHGPPRPRRLDEDAHAMTRELPRVNVSGTAATQPISTLTPPLRGTPAAARAIAPTAPATPPRAAARASDLSELTPISIARITPVSELTPTSIPRPTRPSTEATPISMPRAARPTPNPAVRSTRESPPLSAARPTPNPTTTRTIPPDATPIVMPRPATRPGTESSARAARPTPAPTSPRHATTRPIPTTRAATAPGRGPDDLPRDPGPIAQGTVFDAPTQRDSSAYGSDPGVRPPYDAPAPRESSNPNLRPPTDARGRTGSDPALRRPTDSDPALRRPHDGSSIGLGLQPDPQADDARGAQSAPAARRNYDSPGLRQPLDPNDDSQVRGSQPARRNYDSPGLRQPLDPDDDGHARSASQPLPRAGSHPRSRQPTAAPPAEPAPRYAAARSSASLRLPSEAELDDPDLALPQSPEPATLRPAAIAEVRRPRAGSEPAARRPQDGSSPGHRLPADAQPARRPHDGSSPGHRLPADAQPARRPQDVASGGPADPQPRRSRDTAAPPAPPAPPAASASPEPMILRVPSARPAPRRRQVSSTDSPHSHEVKALIAQRLKILDQGADHFQLLGIAQDVSADALRRAYFGLARQLHPDRLAALGISDDGKHAQRLFAQINAGFAVLSDADRRAQYVSILRRGGEAAVRADEARAEELARRVLDAEEAFRRGELALRRDQPQAAVGELTLAVQLNPEEADYHALLAWSQFCAAPDKMAAATFTRTQLDKAIQRSPHAVTARFYLGRVERMLGRDQDAARYFREVLAAAPAHTEAAAELRVLESRLGDKPGGGGGLFGRKR